MTHTQAHPRDLRALRLHGAQPHGGGRCLHRPRRCRILPAATQRAGHSGRCRPGTDPGKTPLQRRQDRPRHLQHLHRESSPGSCLAITSTAAAISSSNRSTTGAWARSPSPPADGTPQAPSPRARSFCRSRTDSRPTATRNKPLDDARLGALLVGQPPMGGGGRMGDGGLGVAQVGGDGHDPGGIHHRQAASRPPLTSKDSRPPKPLCWRRGQFVLGMGGQPRIVDPLHAGLPFQPGRQLPRLFAVGAHAQPRVSSPLRNTQALKGLMVGPQVRRKPNTSLPTRSRSPTTAPPTQRPWPSRYLVAEWMTMSAPRASGCCSAGVQKQLSTTSRQPLRRASSARARMSTSSVSGLEGVSTNSRRVSGRMARSQASRSARARSWSPPRSVPGSC
jgi:hypothetical protein